MAAIISEAPEGIGPPARRRPPQGGHRLALDHPARPAVYFLIPLYAALRFAGIAGFGLVITRPASPRP